MKIRQSLVSAWEFLETFVIIIAVVWIVRSFLIQPFLVSGASMEPNFSDGNYLVVNELTYRLRAPQRGEVVVFSSPADSTTYFIKRIIGLPGETVAIRNGAVSVNGTPLKESYLSAVAKTTGDIEVALRGDEYFVLGDNRSYSYDSRSWGPLPRDHIVGLVKIRLWPLNEVMAVEAPAY